MAQKKQLTLLEKKRKPPRHVRLAVLLDELPKPEVCYRHPRPVFYDGEECPCCELIRESGPKTRLKIFKGK